ncbi:hypothetical protein SPURM210S_06198 [Streptomyces purpurascens]
MSPTPARIIAVDTHDIRFPTSRELDGSDAMNPDPDYSAAYVVLRTDAADATRDGFAFTIGRGNEVQVAAIDALRGTPDRPLGRRPVRRPVHPEPRPDRRQPSCAGSAPRRA